MIFELIVWGGILLFFGLIIMLKLDFFTSIIVDRSWIQLDYTKKRQIIFYVFGILPFIIGLILAILGIFNINIIK